MVRLWYACGTPVVFMKNVTEGNNRIPQKLLKNSSKMPQIQVRIANSFTKIRVTIFILKINLIGAEIKIRASLRLN